jgi:D-alanyl-lipoteichoic acid acyltransferase DltB (MBOAT superfamily)
VVIGLALIAVLVGMTQRCVPGRPGRNRLLVAALLLIMVLFISLKTEPLAAAISRIWRGLTRQDTSLAASLDLNWLGFSYIVFRLLHTVRDRQTGQLPALSLREYVIYVVFFPAIIAGPIDRAERFLQDARTLPSLVGLDATCWLAGLARITVGAFKKFIVADTLAQGMALTSLNAMQAESTLGLWALLYGYALRLFFDFSGYSDIAIGLAILLGVYLPENFNRPYLQTSLAAFWQSWHMTLSNWARFYLFSPLSRWLLTRQRKPAPTVIVLVSQLTTMIAIGLWHGVTLNFLIWGLWHGLGLFMHKQWSDRTRRWYRELNQRRGRKRAWIVFTWCITFHYVVLGWVWFALPEVGQSLRVFARLFGIR